MDTQTIEQHNEEQKVPKILDALRRNNNEAWVRLMKINPDEFHVMCERFKDCAGEVACAMQMVSHSTVEFLIKQGIPPAQLSETPVAARRMHADLMKVKNYLTELLSYID